MASRVRCSPPPPWRPLTTPQTPTPVAHPRKLRGAHVHRYARVAKYLEITRRAEVLNKRLDIIKELFDMLASEYHNSHASMLEWIVIILILIEVFFQVLSLITDNGSISIFRTDD